LLAINVDTNSPAYSSIGGTLLNQDATALLQYPGGVGGNYTVPLSVNRIAADAFYGCIRMAAVTIGVNVTNIGPRAFCGCTNLSAVYFQGNAPRARLTVFSGDPKATVYYPPDTKGWGSMFGGLPTAMYHMGGK